jgi:hypothetical protein
MGQKSKSKSYCDWRSVGQSVSQFWCRAPSGAQDQVIISVCQLQSCFCGVPSLTRGRVRLLYTPLALASAVLLGSILLSQIWEFPFRRLLRLTGSWWRYSTPPPHGLLMEMGEMLKQIYMKCEGWGWTYYYRVSGACTFKQNKPHLLECHISRGYVMKKQEFYYIWRAC